jgi:metal-responsive CopG/Arc/MetJ family transcriptional regulator
MKTVKSVRLPQWLLNEVEDRLKTDPASDFTTLVENSLRLYLMENDPVSKMLTKCDNQLSYVIEHLEVIRDHDEENWSDKLSNTLNQLYKASDELRKAPNFIECVLPDDFPDEGNEN